jgi:hypothetical protein
VEIGEIAVPVKTKTVRDIQLTIHTVTGEPSFDEIMDAFKLFYEKHPTKNSLLDVRSASLVRLSNKAVQFFVDYCLWHGEVRAGGKMALVVSKELDDGMLKISEAFGDSSTFPISTKVFRSMDEAIKWFGKEG